MIRCCHGETSVQGRASVQQQLHFLQQLLTLVPGSKPLSGSRMDTELLLNELYASENVSQLSHMLTPTFDPWPSHIKYVQSFCVLSSIFLFSSKCFFFLIFELYK